MRERPATACSLARGNSISMNMIFPLASRLHSIILTTDSTILVDLGHSDEWFLRGAACNSLTDLGKELSCGDQSNSSAASDDVFLNPRQTLALSSLRHILGFVTIASFPSGGHQEISILGVCLVTCRIRRPPISMGTSRAAMTQTFRTVMHGAYGDGTEPSACFSRPDGVLLSFNATFLDFADLSARAARCYVTLRELFAGQRACLADFALLRGAAARCAPS